MKIKRIIYLITGFIFLGIGAVGTVIPILPSFPFFMVVFICFAKSSEKMHDWFISTKLYKNNLEGLIKGKGMTRKSKIKVMSMVTITMGIGFIMMDNVPIGRVILAVVWAVHIIYFTFIVKNGCEVIGTPLKNSLSGCKFSKKEVE